jgi:hypothetical protein
MILAVGLYWLTCGTAALLDFLAALGKLRERLPVMLRVLAVSVELRLERAKAPFTSYLLVHMYKPVMRSKVSGNGSTELSQIHNCTVEMCAALRHAGWSPLNCMAILVQILKGSYMLVHLTNAMSTSYKHNMAKANTSKIEKNGVRM